VTDFAVGIDLPGLGAGTAITADIFPHLALAVEAMIQEAHSQWLDFASGAPLPSGMVINNRTGEYARSIVTRQLSDFSGEVFSELPYAKAIEEGMPQRDLKRMLDTSLKVRLTKDGRRYLIIPFRHNAPGSVLGNSMPEPVHDWWNEPGRESSYIKKTGQRPSGTGAFDIHTRKRIMVPNRTYSWGARLKKGDLEGMGFAPSSKVGKNLTGMVRFRKPGGEGGGAHSQFLTFRIMVEGSKGWIAKAQPGKFPARTVAQQIAPIAEEAFRAAAEADIRQRIQDMVGG
jgi:hypothetical protein